MVNNELESLEKFEQNGYLVLRGALNQECLKTLCTEITTLSSTYVDPQRRTPWGYGNLRGSLFQNALVESIPIKTFTDTLFRDGSRVNHIVLNSKTRFFGPQVEWHQEMSNVATFAPGASVEYDWNKFLQVYISLTGEDEDNGGLRIVPCSHELGLLKHHDIISPYLTHKREIVPEQLVKAIEKYGLLTPSLKPGDCLLFNSLLIHGSASNYSLKDRHSLVCQLQDSKSTFTDKKVYDNEIETRRLATLNKLKERVTQLELINNPYQDLKND